MRVPNELPRRHAGLFALEGRIPMRERQRLVGWATRVRRQAAKAGALLASALVIAACASTMAAASPAKVPTEPVIVDGRTGQRVTRSELLARLAGSRYRMLGEIHDNASHHELRAGLIRDIAASGVRPAVALEVFDLDRRDDLRAAQSAHPDNADRIAEQGGLDRRAWRWPLHKPVIDAALSAGLPLAAANVSRESLQRAIRGEDVVAEASWTQRLRTAAWSSAQEAALEASIVEGHCGKLPIDVAVRIARAQRERDAAMAQAMVDAATQDGAILLAGNGHVRNDIGVPAYLGVDDGVHVSVGFVEVDDDARSEAARATAVAANPGFDYIWFTSKTARADPCAMVPDRAAR